MMKACLILLALVATVSAFSYRSSLSKASTSSVKMSFENEIGAQPPLGFWDPLGFLKNADQNGFDRLRYCELKHGRISMLAILGHIVTTKGDRIPGEIPVNFSNMKAGLGVIDTFPVTGFVQLFFFIGALELGFSLAQEDIENKCREAMDNAGWSPETQRRKYGIELNNGRAAMMGIFGLVVHEKLNNDPYVINSLLGYPVPFNAAFN